MFKWLFRNSAKPAFIKSPVQPAPSLEDLVVGARGELDAGRVDEALARLVPWSAHFGDQKEFLEPYGVALFMTGRFIESIRVLNSLLMRDPSHFLALKLLTGAYYQSGQFEDGIANAKKAIIAGAADEQVYNALGAMYLRCGENEHALDAFQTAVQLNPSDLQALANLEAARTRFSAAGLKESDPESIAAVRETVIVALAAKLARNELSITEAEHLSQVIDIRKDTWPIALQLLAVFSERDDLSSSLAYNLATICFYCGRHADGLRLLQRAFALNASIPEIRNGLGSRLVRDGGARWLEGWSLLAETNRLLNPNNYPDSVPVWRGEDLTGRKLFVHFDQGVGDALMAMRFLNHLSARKIKVMLWVLNVMDQLIFDLPPGIELVRADHMPDPRLLGCTFACGLFDLVAGLGVTPEQLAEFSALASPIGPQLIESRPEHLTIALIAMGNPRRADDWFRSVAPEQLQPLMSIPNVRWVNLAVDRRETLERAITQFHLLDPTPQIKNFADTARLLSQVDAVVAIDCAAAHLAAILERPLWILKPTMEDWRWQIGSVISPWWPKARVFRSEAPGQWEQAVKALADDLRAWIESAQLGPP